MDTILAREEAKMDALKKELYEAALEFVSEFPDMDTVEKAHEDAQRMKLTLPDPEDAKLVYSFIQCFEGEGGDFKWLEAREKKSCALIFSEIKGILQKKEIVRKVYYQFSVLSTEDKNWCFEWFKYQKSWRKLKYISDRESSELLKLSMEALLNKEAFTEEMKADEGKLKPNLEHIFVMDESVDLEAIGEGVFKYFLESDAKKLEGEWEKLVGDLDDIDAFESGDTAAPALGDI